jgi:hypothetical protein
MLFAEQIPIIEPLHIHHVMVDQREISHADHGGNQNIKNCLTHNRAPPPLNGKRKVNSGFAALSFSAGALYPGEPIEKPQANGSGNIENHLADFDLDVTVGYSRRCHLVSFLYWKWKNTSFSSAGFLTHRDPCVIPK